MQRKHSFSFWVKFPDSSFVGKMLNDSVTVIIDPLHVLIPEVMKTGSANLNFLCNFLQLPLSNITLFTVLFTTDVDFFCLLSG